MRRLVLLPAALVLVLAAHATAGPSGAPASTPLLVQLERSAPRAYGALLARGGGTVVDAPLRLWRLPSGAAASVLPTLRSVGVVRFVEPDRRYPAAGTDFVDPLVVEEWWRSAVGVDLMSPPGPGVPVTVVDSGIDLSHEEFAARPDLVVLNAQEPPGLGGRHGTMVASVVGAPVNGVGLTGIYPEVLLRTYDAAIGDGTNLATSEIVSGILAATRAGKGVINLSLGGSSRSLSIERAVYEAIRRGSLVVAAAGNAGGDGNPLEYPAAVPHVLTVGATDQAGAPTTFTSRSGFVDMAAPGVDIRVALPKSLGGPYSLESGTSFAAPIVAGAAAWLWTVRPELDATQVAEILRRSARDVGPPGWDPATGYGILDMAAALVAPTPTTDPGEPNDDIEYVDPESESYLGLPSLTTWAHTSARVGGRLTRLDDPRDVFRVWVPQGLTLSVSATADRPLTLRLFPEGATSAAGPGSAGGRLAATRVPATDATLGFRNTKAGRAFYLSVGMPRGGGRDIEYTMSVKARAS